MDQYFRVNNRISIDSFNSLEKSVDFLFLFLLFLFVVFPKTFMAVKAAMIALLMVLALLQSSQKMRFNGNSLILFVYILLNILFTVLGVVRGFSKTAIRQMTINVIWPLCFLLFSGYYVSETRMKKLFRMLVFLTLIICAVDTLIMLASYFHLTFVMTALNKLHLSGFSGTDGLVFFRSEHIFFYAFFTPFMLSVMTMDSGEIQKAGVKLGFLRALAVYSALLSVFSGLGGLWLALFSGVIICILRYHVLRRKSWVAIAVVLFCGAMLVCVVSILRHGFVYYIYQDVIAHVSKDSQDAAATIRNNQIAAMIDTWKRYPILGKGIGSTVGFIKNGKYVEQSDSEMIYFVMLYQRGIVGLLMFFTVAVFSAKSLMRRKDARWLCEPFMVGMICFLISNAFNPLLVNMATVWILYLPFLLGNAPIRDLTIEDSAQQVCVNN